MMARARKSRYVEEDLRELSYDDRGKVFAAVNSGRVVEDERLAPIAIAYARRVQRAGPPGIYRQWWYLVPAVAGIILALVTQSWTWASVIAVAVILGPLAFPRRVPHAARAEQLNREWLEGQR